MNRYTYPTYTIQIKTILNISKTNLWNNISTFKGVNKELYPLLQMTCPDENIKLTKDLILIDENGYNNPLFTSYLLLFGFIPIEYDSICIVDVVEYSHFKERSSMLLMSEWNHDRVLVDVEPPVQSDTNTNSNTDHVLVTDTLSFIPRLTFFGPILKYIVKFLFIHRHSRLIQQYNKGYHSVTTATFI